MMNNGQEIVDCVVERVIKVLEERMAASAASSVPPARGTVSVNSAASAPPAPQARQVGFAKSVATAATPHSTPLQSPNGKAKIESPVRTTKALMPQKRTHERAFPDGTECWVLHNGKLHLGVSQGLNHSWCVVRYMDAENQSHVIQVKPCNLAYKEELSRATSGKQQEPYTSEADSLLEDTVDSDTDG